MANSCSCSVACHNSGRNMNWEVFTLLLQLALQKNYGVSRRCYVSLMTVVEYKLGSQNLNQTKNDSHKLNQSDKKMFSQFEPNK